MNKFLLLTAAITAVFFSSSAAPAREGEKKYDLLFMSGTVTPAENMNGVSALKYQGAETFNGIYYRIIQFREIPSDAEKQELKARGIDLFQYLPNYAFFAAIHTTADIASANTKGNMRAVLPVSPEYKTHPYLKDGRLPEEAEIVNGKADIVISCFKGAAVPMASEMKKKISGLEILMQDDLSNTFIVRLKKEKVSELADFPFVQFIEPYDPPKMENNSGTTEHRSNTINSNLSSGLHYDGTGVGVSVGDGGEFFTHVDFTGRQTGGLSSGAADHGTHVAGTVGGCGNINPRYRGMAPGVNMIYSNGFDDIQSVAAITALYNGADLIRVTNHSLGEGVNLGYNATARMSDLEVESLPAIYNVHSCGNSGTGWNTITGGYKAGKNAIATGALDYKDLITSFSSRGPSKDGRIKPDICAKGNAVQSTMPNNLYNSMSGTSMASPGAAGCFSQLIHAYRSLNTGSDPKLALLKSIVLNTAEDLGNVGPDFTYGWGRMNVWKAYNTIKDQRYLSGTVSTGGSNNHTITVPANVVEMKVMVYWADPAAAAGVTKALINDLDINVKSGNSTYLPWELDFGSPGTAAIKGNDIDNNMEQVSVTTPAAGTYTLNVAGTAVPQGPQEYWVTYEFITDDITVTYPMGGENLVPGETEYVRWDAGGNSGTFTVEYSSDNGTTWSTLSASVAATTRYYTWTVPSGITGQGIIRVTRGSKSDMSDNGFNIIPVPTNLAIDFRCPASFQLSWNAVTGATSYEVFALGTKYMMSHGTTTALNMMIYVPNTAITWASVRALSNSGQVIGRRAVAIQVGTAVTPNCLTGIAETEGDQPYGISVYPNPVSAASSITAVIPEADIMTVKLVDILGNEVTRLADKTELPAGEHTFELDKLPSSGLYFLNVEGSKGTVSAKVMIE